MSIRFKDDPKAYMRAKNSERRASAKARGVCPKCNFNKARPGLVTCLDCVTR